MDGGSSPGLHEAWWLVFSGALGLVVGSFLNVVVYRLPRGESVVSPGSHCPHCDVPIAAWQNIPVLSYLALRGRCHSCKATISARYPLLELVVGLLFAGVVLRHGLDWMTPLWWAFVSILVAAATIDFDEQIIPDELSLGGLGLGLLLVPLAHAQSGYPYLPALLQSVVGALLGGGMLWLVAFGHARWCAARGRRFEHWPGDDEPFPRPGQLDYWIWFPGLGFGDVKLLAMIGAFVGPVGVVYTVLLSALVGLVVGCAFALATRNWNAPFGFGPAIAVGALALVMFPALAWL